MQSPVVRAPREMFRPSFRLTEAIGGRVRRIERLDRDLSVLEAGDEEHAMLRAALSYNAYGTASIEGNPLTLEEVQGVLARGPTPEALRTPDERELLNWASFMRGLGDEELPHKVADVEAMHARLFEGVISARRGLGRIKDRPNYIGSRDGTVVFVPTQPERTALELQNALDWYHESPDPPLVKAWLFHAEFEGIHPFIDGNGRLGRAVMTLMLHQTGYPGVRHALVDYAINQDRRSYYAALQSAHGEPADLTQWLEYLSGVFEDAYSDAAARLTVGRDHGLNARQAEVAAWLLRVCGAGRRIAFGDLHTAFPHVSRRTLQADLRRLVDVGFLDLKGERRTATYGIAERGRKPNGNG